MSHETNKWQLQTFRADGYAGDPGRFGSRRFLLPSALLFAMVLSGCRSRDETASPIPATPPPSATAALPSAVGAVPSAMALSSPASGLSFSAVELELGLTADANHRIRIAVSNFAPTDTIHAAVETMGSGEAMLSVAWTYQDGSVVQQESRSIKATGPRTTEFTLVKPGGLTAGDYTLKISMNGNPVDRKDFSVR